MPGISFCQQRKHMDRRWFQSRSSIWNDSVRGKKATMTTLDASTPKTTSPVHQANRWSEQQQHCFRQKPLWLQSQLAHLSAHHQQILGHAHARCQMEQVHQRHGMNCWITPKERTSLKESETAGKTWKVASEKAELTSNTHRNDTHRATCSVTTVEIEVRLKGKILDKMSEGETHDSKVPNWHTPGKSIGS